MSIASSLRLVLLVLSLGALVGCRHPLEIRGQGSIVERIYGVRGCSYEEFQSSDPRCTENEVIGERYLVSYEAVPEPGWVFSHWEGETTCAPDSVGPYCEFDISKEAVDKVNRDNPGLTLGSTIAVFVRRERTSPPTPLDEELRGRIGEHRLTGDPRPEPEPSIRSPMAQLGMRLFFSKSLSGNFDTACASCHHPALAGGDKLSLPIGTGAVWENRVGPSRKHVSGLPQVPRNAPTTFNSSFYENNAFWDGRITRLVKGGLKTPDSAGADPDAGTDLLAAQARFPVVTPLEMRSHDFLPGAGDNEVRRRIAERIGNYGAGAGEIANNRWLPLFEDAFGEGIPAQELVTFDNIALALSVYQKSQVFIRSPWKAYVDGDYSAIDEPAKRGALLFFDDPPDITAGENGAGCAFCHEGDRFTNETKEAIAFPQIGPGKGSIGADTNDDVGAGLVYPNNVSLRHRFRTSSLLNVSETGPYGHAGSYATLQDVVRHYADPDNTLRDYFSNGGWCQLEQFRKVTNCRNLYPNARENTQRARDKVLRDNELTRGAPPINLTDAQINQIVAFLRTLTDPCVQDRECLSHWIPDAKGAPDGHQLNARNAKGNLL